MLLSCYLSPPPSFSISIFLFFCLPMLLLCVPYLPSLTLSFLLLCFLILFSIPRTVTFSFPAFFSLLLEESSFPTLMSPTWPTFPFLLFVLSVKISLKYSSFFLSPPSLYPPTPSSKYRPSSEQHNDNFSLSTIAEGSHPNVRKLCDTPPNVPHARALAYYDNIICQVTWFSPLSHPLFLHLPPKTLPEPLPPPYPKCMGMSVPW